MALSRNVLFFGATGNIGIPIVSAFLQDRQAFDRLAVFTSPNASPEKEKLLAGWKSQGVEIINGKLEDHDALVKAYEGIDTIVCALGRTGILSQIPLITLADSIPNIKTFIPSEFGTDIEHSPSSASEPPHQAKLKVRAALRSTKNLDYTFVVTGPYPHMYLVNDTDEFEQTKGSWDVKGRKAFIVGDGNQKIGFSAVDDIGKFVVKITTAPSPATTKAALKLESFVASPNEILAEFEKQMGVKWEMKYTSLEELRENEKKAYEKDIGSKTGFTLRRIWGEGGAWYEEWDNGKIGFGKGDTETLSEAVEKAIKVQSS